MSESCRSCPLAGDRMSLGALSMCATPSGACTATRKNLEATFQAMNRLSALAEKCGNVTLSLDQLRAGDVVHLLGSQENRGYGQAGGRALELLVGSVEDNGVLRTTLQRDSYATLPPYDTFRAMAIPDGTAVSLIGYWDDETENAIPGSLVVGMRAVYETEAALNDEGGETRKWRGLLLQEVGVADPAGVYQVMWGTDPQRFQGVADFLKESQIMPS